MRDIIEKAAAIKLVIFDVDGVLTDGSLYYGHDGREYKVFHSRDGHGMKMLQASGVKIAIITARSSQAVTHRMENLGIEHVYQGQLEKLPAYIDVISKLGVHGHEVAYVGDDLVDLPLMIRAGLAISVQDAHPVVKKHSHWITPSLGGHGAARDVCELIMEAHGTLEARIQSYLTLDDVVAVDKTTRRETA